MTRAKIMIVEDEFIVALDLTNRLEDIGHTVCGHAVSGKEDLDKVTEFKPDLIIMDIVLHGELSGIETAEQIHNRQYIPVVFLTADGHRSKFAQAKVTQPYALVLKPCENKELSNTIEKTLSRAKMERE